MSDPIRCEIDVEVRYAETDQMGVVHHANYLVWFEQARTRLCIDTGFHYSDIEKLGYYLMVTGAELSYRLGARYGEIVKVGCWIDRLGSRRMRFAYDVRRDGDLLVKGVTEHIWVEAATGKIRRIPEEVRESFERIAGMRE